MLKWNPLKFKLKFFLIKLNGSETDIIYSTTQYFLSDADVDIQK